MSKDEYGIETHVFITLLFFLIVRFGALDGDGGEYVGAFNLFALIALVLFGLLGVLLAFFEISQKPKTALLQFLVTGYSVWLFFCMFTSKDFPSNPKIADRINSEISQFTWPSTKSNIDPFYPAGLTCNSRGKNDVVILRDRKELSNYHWRVPPCKRASSIKEARYVVSYTETTIPHPTAEWILESPNGTRTSQGPVMIPFWKIEVADRIDNEFNTLVSFEGSISRASRIIHNVTESKQRSDVTRAPVKDFFSYFRIPNSTWTEFYYPEKRFLLLLGM